MITDLTRRAYFVLTAPFPSSFAFDFWFGAAEEFFAVLTLLDGSEVVLVNGTGYTLTDPAQGGTLTRVGTWDATAIALTLYRLTQRTQETDFVAGSKSNPEVLEAALDRIVAMLQEAFDATARSILFPLTDPEGLNYLVPGVVGRALRYISFDALGNVVMSAGTAEAGTADAALLNGRASGHGLGSIPISDDEENTHLFAHRSADADTVGGYSPTNEGDGIPIANYNLSIGLNAMQVQGLNPALGKDGTYGTQSIPAGSGWVPPCGLYIIASENTDLSLSHLRDGTWYSLNIIKPVGLFLFDSIHFQIFNGSSTTARTVYYVKLL